jgi:hypothetical protein
MSIDSFQQKLVNVWKVKASPLLPRLPFDLDGVGRQFVMKQPVVIFFSGRTGRCQLPSRLSSTCDRPY